jgi:hypothetical protein
MDMTAGFLMRYLKEKDLRKERENDGHGFMVSGGLGTQDGRATERIVGAWNGIG